MDDVLSVRVLRDCHCRQRQDAQRANHFYYATAHAGFIFRDEDGTVRIGAKPAVWVTCLFCGGDILERGEVGW